MTEPTYKTKRPSAAYWILVFLLLFALGVSIFLNTSQSPFMALFAHEHDGTDTPTDEFPTFEEEWTYGSGDTKVVHMELIGFISRESEGGMFEPPRDKIYDLQLAIRAAANDEDVKAIVLDIDSPGGGITPSDELYHELLRFKASGEDRKVIIFMRDLAASGGYYVAMAGDWLIAQPTTIIGSIGVIMQSLNWKGLSDRIGVTDTTIKSGENKDLLNPFRETNPAQVAILQEMIDHMHHRFREIVSTSRGLDEETLIPLADGRIFSANQALDLKLIDQVGYWDDVMTKTADMLGVPSIRVVRYYQTYSLFDYLAGVAQPSHPLNSLLPQQRPARLQYLWQP